MIASIHEEILTRTTRPCINTALTNNYGNNMKFFPTKQYSKISSYMNDYSNEISTAFATISGENLENVAEILENAIKKKSTIFVCGNGGSAAIANHFVCDHMKGAKANTNISPRVSSLSTNIEILTAIANDISYDSIFEFQLECQADPGDILITISSSGNSPNIVWALNWAKKNKIKSISFTGFDGGHAKEIADISLHVESRNYGVIEDVHQSLMHILAQYLRQKNLVNPETIEDLKF